MLELNIKFAVITSGSISIYSAWISCCRNFESKYRRVDELTNPRLETHPIVPNRLFWLFGLYVQLHQVLMRHITQRGNQDLINNKDYHT